MKKAIKSAIQRSAHALGYRVDRSRLSIAFDFPKLNRASSHKSDEELQLLKGHLDASPIFPDGLPNLGARWGAYAAKLRERIHSVYSIEELLQIGQSPANGVETQLPSAELSGYVHWYDLDLLTQGISKSLYDTLPSFSAHKFVPDNCTVKYHGSRIDFVTATAAHNILTILDWLGADAPKTICDIGGGTGKYTHAWMTNSAHRPELVVILDIPETLIYSEALLRSSFNSVQYITSEKVIPNKSGIVLCPIGNVKALDDMRFDLVTNYGSMQEMSDGWIDWYMRWLDQRNIRYFYSDNYFANSITNMREGHNSWSPRPSSKWVLQKSRVHLGSRTSATLLYKNEPDGTARAPTENAKGADLWLSLLESVRIDPSEPNLRRALDFALNEMPFIPKEAWQVAKMLSEMTGSSDAFESLKRYRSTGTEALT